MCAPSFATFTLLRNMQGRCAFVRTASGRVALCPLPSARARPTPARLDYFHRDPTLTRPFAAHRRNKSQEAAAAAAACNLRRESRRAGVKNSVGAGAAPAVPVNYGRGQMADVCHISAVHNASDLRSGPRQRCGGYVGRLRLQTPR